MSEQWNVEKERQVELDAAAWAGGIAARVEAGCPACNTPEEKS